MGQEPRGTDVPTDVFGLSQKFASLNHLILRDLNNPLSQVNPPVFSLYKKPDIIRFLTNPAQFEKQLRKAIIYVYGASPHFRRLIQYFVGLTDLAYIIEPYRIKTSKANQRIVGINYRKTLNMISSMKIKTQIPEILTVCLREDVYYGTIWETADDITIQRLPSDYCKISSIEGNVPNVTFNFRYFDSNKELLQHYPPEFADKYENVYKGQSKNRWIELDSPNSFAIKCTSDILNYALPPFVGILPEIYDIAEFKDLKLAKTALDNYAMIAMILPLTDEGEWGIDLDKAREFWGNLDHVLPPEIGSVLTPMKLEKISFEQSGSNSDEDTVVKSEQGLFTAAGVSSLLFNNDKASANALLLSIKADQSITYGLVKRIGDALNRYLQEQPYGKYFKINFLDISPYNRKEMGDAYLKAASYGLPTISAYAASQGIGQAELDSMSFLEGQILGLQDLFRPIQSSTQMSSSDLEGSGATDEGGAPQKDTGELTDSGEQSREDSDDWG